MTGTAFLTLKLTNVLLAAAFLFFFTQNLWEMLFKAAFPPNSYTVGIQYMQWYHPVRTHTVSLIPFPILLYTFFWCTTYNERPCAL